MFSWLQKKIEKSKDSILEVGVFGSVSTGKKIPNDCDLYIVSQKSPESEDWKQLKNDISYIRAEFRSQYKLILNVILMTHEEWEEKNRFFPSIFNRNINK